MKILVTGNLGYVGAYLTQYLRSQFPNAFIAGYDLGYFQQCLTTDSFAPETLINTQFYGDVRNFDEKLLAGFDQVIHLAAISNDPIGNKFEQVTLDVNFKATVDIAQKAINQGVKNFVFASSCSVYGAIGNTPKTETSELNPLSAYAKSKVNAEEGLSKLNAGDTIITCLRFATACGMSNRLRLDLVLNDFIASAMSTKKINILSDGSPWRPLINVKDMARAIHWSIQRNENNGGKFLICNTGSNSWNYTVKELAERVQSHFSDIQVSVNPDAPADKRSYKVNFDYFTSLAEQYTPVYNLDKTIDELIKGLNLIHFEDADFRNSSLMRLNVLNQFISRNQLDNNLNWK
jgi:nucleoside-diphosphate-sugar epimerase